MSSYPPSPNQGFQPSYQQQPFGQPPYQQPMPPVKKSRTWLIVLLVVGGSALTLVEMCVISALAFFLTKRKLPVAQRDREVVVDIQRLETFVEGYHSNARHETIEKYRYLDGSHEVFYVFFAGVYFDDPSSIRELLMPVLPNLESYQP